MEDPGVNALLIASEHALAEIAVELGTDPAAHPGRAEAKTTALLKRLWDPEAGLFPCHDVLTCEATEDRSGAGLIPLIVPGLPAHAPTRCWHRRRSAFRAGRGDPHAAELRPDRARVRRGER